jgi:hypothetical protein
MSSPSLVFPPTAVSSDALYYRRRHADANQIGQPLVMPSRNGLLQALITTDSELTRISTFSGWFSNPAGIRPPRG